MGGHPNAGEGGGDRRIHGSLECIHENTCVDRFVSNIA